MLRGVCHIAYRIAIQQSLRTALNLAGHKVFQQDCVYISIFWIQSYIHQVPNFSHTQRSLWYPAYPFPYVYSNIHFNYRIKLQRKFSTGCGCRSCSSSKPNASSWHCFSSNQANQASRLALSIFSSWQKLVLWEGTVTKGQLLSFTGVMIREKLSSFKYST